MNVSIRTLTSLGLPGCLGLALLVLAAWLYWGEAPAEAQLLSEQEESLSLLRDQLQQATSADKSGPAAALNSPADTEALWQQLWQFLPAADTGRRMQADVLALARKRGIQLGSVQFHGEALPGLPSVWRQRITLPVQAPYPVLRTWVNDVLQAPAWGPAVSLDALVIERSDVMTDEVKARVVWSLWWRVSP